MKKTHIEPSTEAYIDSLTIYNPPSLRAKHPDMECTQSSTLTAVHNVTSKSQNSSCIHERRKLVPQQEDLK
jgi:hypothetical protein